MLLKLIKFCVVGFSGMLIDFSVTYLLKEKIKIHRYIANSLGFCTAVSSNYLFNRVWTFNSTSSKVLEEFSIFIFISVIGLIINNGFLYLFEEKGKLNFYIAKLMAIAVTTIWNFSVNYFFNFQP